MASHHTKDKGDLGVAKVHADLAEQGLMVLFPMTEHAPFDLVAYDGARFHRVQVKYRTADRRGAIEVRLRGTWNDRQGTHYRAVDKSEIDVVAIYCPDTAECYYLSVTQMQMSVTVRLSPTRNGQLSGVRNCIDFRSFEKSAALSS